MTKDPNYFGLILEKCDGDLRDLLDDKDKHLSLDQKLQILVDIAVVVPFLSLFTSTCFVYLTVISTIQGMQYLYLSDNGKEVVQHRDLKAKNCLLVVQNNDKYRAKLTDFGLSESKALVKQTEEKTEWANIPPGTLTHMAPEVLLNKGFSEKSDVYSFGVLTWEVLSRADPFQGEGLMWAQFQAQVPLGKRPVPVPTDSPQELVTLMRECWDTEPFHRPTFNEIVSELKHITGLKGTASLSSDTTTISVPPSISSESPAFDLPSKGASGLSAPELSPASNTSSSEERSKQKPRLKAVGQSAGELSIEGSISANVSDHKFK